MKELKYLGYTYKEIHFAFDLIQPCKLRKLHIFSAQKEEAKNIAKLRKIPFGDALHAILRRDNNLQLISEMQILKKPKILLTQRNRRILFEFFI
ncbi:hypothetical protein HY837_01820 [archaeon]|nr:hypothetical protein [archaeon]